MKRIAIVPMLLALAAAVSPAEELSSKDKKWLKACLEALKSDTDEVREGAELSLARFGLDALPCVLDAVPRIRKDEVKEALVRAICGMGRGAAVRRLKQIKLMDAKKYGKKADTLIGWIGEDEPRALEGIDPGKSPDRVVDAIRDVLSDVKLKRQTTRMFTNKIVDLGRDAIPELVRLIRRLGPDEFEDFGVRETVCDALARLVVEDDLPLLAALLAEGQLQVARCFRKLKSEAALTALLAPVKKGMISGDLLEALDRFREQPVVVETLLGHLKKHGRGEDGESVAEWMAKAGVKKAVPLVLALANAAKDRGRRVSLAESLVRLGETGIPILIEVLGKPDAQPYNNYPCCLAGEALNRVARESFYVGKQIGEKGPTGNFVEAAQRYAEWWSANRDRLTFDDRTRRWLVK